MSWRDSVARLIESTPELGGPVGAEIRGRAARWAAKWADPRARLLRERRRAGRRVAVRSAVTGVSGITAAAATGPAAVFLEIGFGSAAVIAGVAATVAGAQWYRLRRVPLPAERRALPPPASSAHGPMVLLAQAQAGLDVCLRQLRSGAATTDYVTGIEDGAAEAAAALYATADRLTAVEAAVAATPPAGRGPLLADARTLHGALVTGVEGFQSLVGEAGRAVAAGGHTRHTDQARRAVIDAADRLRGLSAALGDLQQITRSSETTRQAGPHPYQAFGGGYPGRETPDHHPRPGP